MSATGGARTGRLALLLPAMLALVLGVLAGLARIGWSIRVPASAIDWHGALMVSGFFGTLISLERAVAIGRAWAYAAPFCAGASVLAWVAGVHPWIGGGLALAAASVTTLASAQVFVRQRAVFTATMALGALSWWIGNLLFLAGLPGRDMVQWWVGFLVLTIAGERLELSRLVPRPTHAERLFVGIVGLFLLSAIALSFERAFAERLYGLSLVGAAAWLARYDVARRTLMSRGLPRYAATALLGGYAWLALAGLLWAFAIEGAPFGYDAALHAVFLGFVLSMVFAHAPIILPAVARVPIRYGPALYAPLFVLHATLALRVVGDLSIDAELRRAGALGNALAVVMFVGAIVWSSTRAPAPAARR